MVAAAAYAPVPKLRRTILVADDDPDILDAFTDLLEAAGYEVVPAVSGREALELLLRNNRRPSLILLDLKMPERSGYEVLQAIRDSTTLMSIPVVVVSAYLGLPPAGAVAWLKKPVPPHVLLTTVDKHIKK